MKKSTKFSPEVRERAVRMVFEVRPEYSSQWAAIQAIAPKIGSTQTLCNWVRRHERDTGQRDGVSTAEARRIKELEREVRELKRVNEILRLVGAFFAQAGSTATGSREGVHRRAQGPFRGRADLQSPAGCPVDVLAACCPAEEPGPALPA